MQYFLDTTDTIIDGVGFSQFGILHIVWMIVAAVTIIGVSRIYKAADSVKRAKIRKIVAGLVIFDEIWKMFFFVPWNGIVPILRLPFSWKQNTNSNSEFSTFSASCG